MPLPTSSSWRQKITNCLQKHSSWNQLLTKAQQLESTISQVSKALCGKEKATLKELLQAADQLKTRALRWISVEERLPEDYEDVVIIMREGASSWYRVAYREYGGWSFGGGRRVNCEVTHWMPLPEPPEEDEK